jgi:peptidoglycan/LPS O-acetylase OafA/YrhL
MAATAPTSTVVDHGRFPGFDGLRAIAALAVLLTHVADSGGANAPHLLGIFFARMDGGVAVFFVLSGVLLTRPFARAIVTADASPDLRAYLWRRAIRIYPAYWLATTVIVFVFGATDFPSVRSAVLDYTLLHIYSPHQPDVFAPLVQAWTLSTEVTFYLFLPLWAAVMRRVATGPAPARVRRLIVSTVVLGLLSLAWKALVLGLDVSDGRLGQLKMWLPWWLDLFAAGMAMAVLTVAVEVTGWSTPRALASRWAPAVCWLGAGLALWWVAAGAGLSHTSGVIPRHLLWGQHYLYGATAVLLVVPFTFGPQERSSSRIRALMSTRALVFLGTISYGIYLWHEGWIAEYLDWTGLGYRGVYPSDVPAAWHTNAWFSLPWLTMLVAVLALTIATATVSWYLLERPILRSRHRFDRVRT